MNNSILPTSRDVSRSEPEPAVDANNEDYICDICLRALTELITKVSNHDGSKGSSTREIRARHTTLQECVQAAHAGCGLCPLISEKLIAHAERLQRNYEETWNATIHLYANVHQTRHSGYIEAFSASLGGSDIPESYFEISWASGAKTALYHRILSKSPPLKLALQWLDGCYQFHRSCPKLEDVELPTRLLYIPDDFRNNKIRLQQTRGHKGRYFALSHCWGSRTPHIRTTSGTTEQYYNGIDFRSFPKTFRDAVTVTHALGCQYLWIDTLCIIQDSTLDWRNECEKMAKIYSNAALTLAADISTDAYHGFLQQRSPYLGRYGGRDQGRRLQVSLVNGSSEMRVMIGPCDLFESKTPSRTDLAVLGSRAWAVQERLLSPRVLHFGQYQMYMECETCEFHEDCLLALPLGQEQARTEMPKSTLSTVLNRKDTPGYEPPEFYNCWLEIVEAFSRCKISRSEDTLPAISGIAQKLDPCIPGPYLHGVWESDFLYGLTWYREGMSTRWETTDSPSSAPSWSWASCNHPVKFQFSHSTKFRPEFGGVWRPGAKFIGVNRATHRTELAFRGPVSKNLRLRSIPIPESDSHCTWNFRHDNYRAVFTLDEPEPKELVQQGIGHDPKLFSLLLLFEVTQQTLALILYPVGDHLYRRVGIMRAHACSVSGELWKGTSSRVETVSIV